MIHMTENEMVMCSLTIENQCNDYHEPLQIILFGWSFNKQVKKNETLIVAIVLSCNKQHDFGLWKDFKSCFIC
jgi:hypothetical protein